MDLQLLRADLLQVDVISASNTLKLLPPGKKKRQKLVVGDDSGTVHCYEFTKGEPQLIFASKTFERPVSSVSVGGISSRRDKIFASCDQKIVGISKKGKELFDLHSTLTEPIISIAADESKIWSSCDYVHNTYDNGKDVDYYMAPDKINDSVVENITREFEYDVVLACQDKCLRILTGSQCRVEIPVSSPVCSVTTLTIKRGNGINGYDVDKSLYQGSLDFRDDVTGILYGMETGEIGYVQVYRGGILGKSWCIKDNNGMKENSKVNAIIVVDLTKNGVSELIVGRDDGRVEVFRQTGTMDMSLPPLKMFSESLRESVRSVQCGFIDSSEHLEIVVAVYSGKIVSLTLEAISQNLPDDDYGRSQSTESGENTIRFLKAELKQLHSKVDKEKDKLKSMASGTGDGQTLLAKVGNIGAENFPMRSSFIFDHVNVVYKLKIEIQLPLDMVILRSPAVLELEESSNPHSITPSIVPYEYNDVNVSFTNVSEINSACSHFVATYICRNDEKKLEINLRPNEGYISGDLIVVVSVRGNPTAVKVVKFQIKPLSLHSRIYDPMPTQLSEPRSSICFHGSTSIHQSLEWASQLFPGMPQRIEDNVKEVTLHFMNSFTKAITLCILFKDHIIIESESYSSLSTIKETISELSLQRRLRLQEQMTIREDTASLFLFKLWPQIANQLSFRKKIELVDSLEEINTQEGDTTKCWLSVEYDQILTNRDNILAEFTKNERAIHNACNIMMDWYLDWLKLVGKQVKNVVINLDEIEKFVSMNDKRGLLSLFRRDSDQLQ